MYRASSTETNIIRKLLFFMLGGYIFFAPLFEGLFASVEFLAPLILLMFFSLFYRWKHQINTKLLLVLLAFGSVYFLAAIPAVDQGQALVEAYRNLLAVLLFLLFLQITPNRVELFFRLIYYSGVAAAVISLSGLFTDLFLSGSFPGHRLQGVFNYANATAIFMLLAVFLGIFLALQKLQWQNLLTYAGVYLCACTLIFSGSRAVWLLWPAAAFFCCSAGEGW